MGSCCSTGEPLGNIMFRLAVFAACLSVALSLSCSCGTFPCQTPVCCPSGMYTLDECGCIKPLADHGIEELAEGWCFLENLQDPSNPTENCYDDVEFSVADGKFWSTAACFAERNTPKECLSVTGKSCIFPFSYQGSTYGACTQAGSENGAAWCATEVDETGEVVRNTWEDCDLACPQEGSLPA